MSQAIQPYLPSDRSLVQFETDETKCNVRLQSVNRARRIATYEIAVANAAHETLSCRFFVVESDASQADLGTLFVGPGSIVRSRFAVPLDRRHRAGRIFVQLHGERVEFLGEAQPPESVASSRSVRYVVATLLAACALGGIGTVGLFGKPSVAVLNVQRSVAPGLVRARYALSGAGSGTYEAADANGRPIAVGTLSAASGEIAFVVPPGEAGQSLRLEAAARNWFGSQTRSAQFEVDVAPPSAARALPPSAPQARIATLIAHRDAYGSRPSVLASYVASGQHGTLQVSDSHGAVLGTAPFSHVGTTRVLLSHDDPLQPLNARLDVDGPSSHAQATVEIPPETAAPAISAPQLGYADGVSRQATGQAFSVDERVVAGHPFEIGIDRVLPQMHIALQDKTGSTLDEVDVTPSARAVTFQAPAGSRIVQTYYLVCTYTRALGQESLIQPISVFPD